MPRPPLERQTSRFQRMCSFILDEGERKIQGAPFRPTREQWEQIFNHYDVDVNRDNKISLSELKRILNSNSKGEIPDYVAKKIMKEFDLDRDGTLDFDEFMRMVEHPNFRSIYEHLVYKYVDIIVPRRRGMYERAYSCWPPPLGMIIISLVEIVLYCLNASVADIDDYLMFDPKKKIQIWRFFSYMFAHNNALHLIFNLIVQIMLGTTLEMVHGWWRVLIIYFAGVLSGSLATSILEPTVKLVGASGGVLAMVTAHIATTIMNWREMDFACAWFMIFVILACGDFFYAIYNHYGPQGAQSDYETAYSAHLGGAIAGLLVGIYILRNLHETTTEKKIWWIATVLYVLLMGSAIVWNLFS